MRKFNTRIYASKGATSLRAKNDSRSIPSSLALEAQLDIQAADGEAEGPPKFNLVANTGTPMLLGGFFDPVIVDMEGAKFHHKVTPVIADHDVGKRIGHTTRQAILPAGSSRKLGGAERSGPLIYADGIASSRMGIAQGFVEDAKAGFPFQVSIGADIVEAYYVEEGEKAKVNGKSYKGPLIVASKTVVRELSVTVLGADGETSAQIAAYHHPRYKELSSMNPFQEWLKANGFVEEDLTEKQLEILKAQWEATQASTTQDPPPVKATAPVAPAVPDIQETLRAHREAIAADMIRTDRINQLFARFPNVTKVKDGDKEVLVGDFKAKALSTDMDPSQVELALLKADFPATPTGPAIHITPDIQDLEAQAVACALAQQMGMVASKEQKWSGEKYGYEHFWNEQTLEASRHTRLRSISLHQLMDMTVRAAGGYYSGNRKSDDFIRETRSALTKIKANASGPTSLDISNIFDDLANKMLLAAYQSVDTTWQEIAATQSVSDFKTYNMYRLISKGSYHVVGADGQLEHGEFDDQKYTVTADTYGKIVGLDRKHLINDDLNAFRQIMTMLGMEAAKALEELVYVVWMTALGTTYTAGQGNYISGATTVLGIPGLTAAALAMDNQTLDDAPLLITADRMLVGTQDRIVAGRLYSQPRTEATGSTDDVVFVDNPHVGNYRPIVTPYLNNTAVKQRVDVNNLGAAIPGQSSTQWFLFNNPATPMGATINVALLNGNRTPFLEQADAQFDMLGLRWRGYHDFGVGIGDPLMSLMSKGAA